MSFTNYLENKVLDHVFGATTFTPPATMYLGFSTTTIADDGTNITEPSGGAYARVSFTNDGTNWSAASAGTKQNGAILTFPEATLGWGIVTDFFISDAASGGNILIKGVLSVPRDILLGDIPKFNVSGLTITLD